MEDSEDYDIVTNLSCPTCIAYVEVYQYSGEENEDLITKSMKDMKWQPQHTKILIDWADKAMCYRWLHTKCTHKYTLANAWFTIPVIIISTLTYYFSY